MVYFKKSLKYLIYFIFRTFCTKITLPDVLLPDLLQPDLSYPGPFVAGPFVARPFVAGHFEGAAWMLLVRRKLPLIRWASLEINITGAE
jgi:hypothetical protein